jgi:hypothetical protein
MIMEEGMGQNTDIGEAVSFSRADSWEAASPYNNRLYMV